jgi:hypothetical protein
MQNRLCEKPFCGEHECEKQKEQHMSPPEEPRRSQKRPRRATVTLADRVDSPQFKA